MALVRGLDQALLLTIASGLMFAVVLIGGARHGAEANGETSRGVTEGRNPSASGIAMDGDTGRAPQTDEEESDPPAKPSSTTTLAVHAGAWHWSVATLVLLPLVWMLLDDIGDNPVGLFCDEAEIGLEAYRLLSQPLDGFRPPVFYQHFGYSHLGALPVYASAPLVWLLGLSDLSIRLVSVVWTVAAIVVLFALMRRLGWRNGEVAVLLFASAPVFLHIGRINFGHAPSLFCVCTGMYALARARDGASIRWALVCGTAFGLSVYGNAAYYLATPVIVASFAIGEMVVSKRSWRRYRPLAVATIVMALIWIPIVVKAVTDERFLDRYLDKEGMQAPLLSVDRALTMIDNYPKYFSGKYLFTDGEAGLPGGSISRHSVPGAGILPWLALPLIVLGVVAIFRHRTESGRPFAVAGLTMLVLYPLPDLVTTTRLNPPYTFAVFPTMIFVPLLAGYGLDWASGWGQGRWRSFLSSRVLPAGLVVVILFGAMRFYTGPYERYPEVSAGYYGWQQGAHEAVDVFQERAHEYDRYLLDPDYSEAFVFLDFYLVDDPELRAKSAVGSTELVDLRETRLFAIRAERFDRLMGSGELLRRYVHVIDIIPYPDGSTALYLVEIGFEHQRPGEMPW